MLILALSLVPATATAFIDYHHYRRLVVPGILLTLVGLVIVFIIGEIRHGAVRSLDAGSYMPSEAAKIATIIYLSVWLYSKRNVLSDINFGLLPLAGILGIVSGLIMAQPDLSAAATIIIIGGFLFFLAGGDLKQIAILIIVSVLVGWVVVQIHPTGSDRISKFIEGFSNPVLVDYHVLRSLESFIKGGFFGVGIGKADTKYTGLPVAPTDSIFAVLAEETGFIGTTILIALYLLFLWRGMRIAKRAPDMLGTLLASGITLWIVLEAFINMAVMVNLLPFAGNALPLISAGGSNLMVTLTSLGILINISRHSEANKQTDQRSFNAPDGVRRSQRRRNQPRPRRASGAR